MQDPIGIDLDNPMSGYLMVPGIYIHWRIAESKYLNWSEKVLLACMELGYTDNKWLSKYMGFKAQTIRNMKHQISRKLKAHNDRFPGL